MTVSGVKWPPFGLSKGYLEEAGSSFLGGGFCMTFQYIFAPKIGEMIHVD